MSVSITGGPMNFDATINGTQFQASIRNIERDLNRLTEQTKKSGNDLDNLFKKAAVSAASFFSIQAAGDFVKSLVQVRGEFQQLEIAYATILKSKEKGDALFAETVKLAATTPFTLQEVAQGTKQLLAYGFGAQEVTGVLTTLGNVAAGVSAPLGDIAYLYGTLKTQGRAYAMDIRQFTGRGIPIVAELAKQFGVTEKQVNALVTAGKVGFPEVEKAFKSLTGSGGIFFNLMAEQSKTLTGQLSNLSDAFSRMLNDIGKGQQGLFSFAISSATDLVNNYQTVLDIIQLLVVTYGTYRAVLLVTAAVQGVVASGAGAMTAAELLHYGALVLVQRAQLAWNSAAVQGAIATAAYTAVIVAIIVAIKSWTDATELAQRAQKSLNDIRTASVEKITDEKTKIAGLIGVIKDHNNSQADRLLALKKLNEISPEFLGNITAESIKTGEATKAIDNYLKALDRRLTGEAAYSTKLENNKRIAELKTKGIDAISATEHAGLSLKRFFTGKGSWKSLISGETDQREIVADLISGYEKANRDIDKLYAGQLREQITGNTNSNNANIEAAIAFEKNLADVVKNFNKLITTQTGKKDLEAIQTALNDALDVPNIDDAKINKIKSQLTKVGDMLKKYSLSNDKAVTKAADSEFEKRRALYDQIAELQAQSLSDAKTADEKEVDQVKAKYKNILDAIEDYNRKAKVKIDPKNIKLKDGTIVNVPKSQQSAEDDVTAKQDVERFKVIIDQKKAAFDEFARYKLDAGEKAAKELYAYDLGGFESYVKYLQSLMPSQADLSAKANAMRDLLNKLLPIANKDEAKRQSEQFASLLSENATYFDKRKAYEAKYSEESAALRAKGYNKEADQLAENYRAETIARDIAHAETLDAYKELFDGVAILSADRAKKDIASLKAYIDNALKAGTITKEAYNKINASLNGATENINKGIPDGLRNIGYELSNIGSLAGQFDEILGRALGTIGNIVSGIGNMKQGILDFNKAKAANDTFGKISSGLGIFGNVVNVVTGVVGLFTGLFSHAKQAAEQAKYTQDLQIKATEAVNKLLERQAGLIKEIYGTQRLTAFKKQLDDIAKAQAAANTALSGRYTLTGNRQVDEELAKRNTGSKGNPFLNTLIDQIKALGLSTSLANKPIAELQNLLDQGKIDDATAKIVQSLIDLDQQAKATRNALTEEITGINFDSFTEKIRGVFDSGKTDVKSFADAIEDEIAGAFSNAFKRKEIEQRMQPLFDALYSAGEDGTFTGDEIKKLRDMRDKIAQELSDRAKVYEQIIGPDATIDNASAANNAIKGITSDEANALEGLLRGQYDINKKLLAIQQGAAVDIRGQFDIMTRGIKIWQNIETNTANTVEELRNSVVQLKAINKNTGGQTGRDLGI